MNWKEGLAILIIVLVFVSTLIGGCVYLMISAQNQRDEKNFENGYKQACIDFYKGKLKYDLIEKEDGTRIWEEVKQNDRWRFETLFR